MPTQTISVYFEPLGVVGLGNIGITYYHETLVYTINTTSGPVSAFLNAGPSANADDTPVNLIAAEIDAGIDTPQFDPWGVLESEPVGILGVSNAVGITEDSNGTPYQSEIVSSGSDLSQEWNAVVAAEQTLSNEELPYAPLTLNSNSMVTSALVAAGLQPPTDTGFLGPHWAPGAENDLFGVTLGDILRLVTTSTSSDVQVQESDSGGVLNTLNIDNAGVIVLTESSSDNGFSKTLTDNPDGAVIDYSYSGPDGTGALAKADIESPNGTSLIATINSATGASTTTLYAGPNGTGNTVLLGNYTYANVLGGSVGPTGINDAGQIVGNDGNGGFLDTNGAVTLIVPPGAIVSSVNGVNNSGQVVGTYNPSPGVGFGFLYSGGTYTQLAVPGALFTGASGINDLGHIVGGFGGPAGLDDGNFVYENGIYVTLPNPPFSGASNFEAVGINDAGQIVGNYSGSNGLGLGFLYENGTYTTINDPNGGWTVVDGINNAGQIVGEYFTSVKPLAGAHGFIYSDGIYTTINGPIAGADTVLLGINDEGELVGVSGGTSFVATPVIAPAAPSAPSLGSIPIASNAPATTNSPNPVFTGTAAPGSTVSLYDGSALVGIGQADAQGTWTIAASNLPFGVQTVTATATDASGLVSTASSPTQVTVDSPTTTRFQLANNSAVLQLGNQNNTVQFGNGVVAVVAGDGANRIAGGNGNDFISVRNGSNAISLGNGNNQVIVGTGANSIVLGNGNNVVADPPGNGRVTVTLGAGDNQVTLGDGNDSVTAGHGSNQITLGNGNDQIVLNGIPGATDTIAAGNGNDQVILGGSQNQITLGNGDDLIVAGNGNNAILVGFGDDTVILGGGANQVTLGNGRDIVFAGNGNNTIALGDGNDTVLLGNGNNSITLGGGKDTVQVGNGTNSILLGSSKDTVIAGHGTLDLIFTSTASELTMNDFNATTDDLIFRGSVFDLGADNALATATPQAIGSALFSPNTNGTFATAQDRFAYDQKTGNLWYDSAGSAAPASRVLVASLENHLHLTAADLFFVT